MNRTISQIDDEITLTEAKVSLHEANANILRKQVADLRLLRTIMSMPKAQLEFPQQGAECEFPA